MRKRVFLAVLLIAYTAVLINFIVFKNVPDIHIGHRTYRFGGGTVTGPPQLEPFKTTRHYAFGSGGRLIARVELIANVLPFLPIGFLASLLIRGLKLRTAVVLAVATGLTMEALEVAFQVGIFDIDDVILNALGVMTGYWLYRLVPRRTGTERT